ncbi:MAG: hypothetical protein LBT40_08400 [Deltaproteobacteria bacterium]|nr:hypothetical protein [Deltaproteobacteria bacterium]
MLVLLLPGLAARSAAMPSEAPLLSAEAPEGPEALYGGLDAESPPDLPLASGETPGDLPGASEDVPADLHLAPEEVPADPPLPSVMVPADPPIASVKVLADLPIDFCEAYAALSPAYGEVPVTLDVSAARVRHWTDLFSGTPDEGAYRAYLDAALAAAALEAERSRLERKRRSEGLTPEESKRLAELPGLIDQSRAAFIDLCERLRDLLGGGTGRHVPHGMELTLPGPPRRNPYA